MNKIILIGLCISLILLSGCDSYDSCIRDCRQLKYNCNCEGCLNQKYLNSVVDHICSVEEDLMCYEECKGS